MSERTNRERPTATVRVPVAVLERAQAIADEIERRSGLRVAAGLVLGAAAARGFEGIDLDVLGGRKAA